MKHISLVIPKAELILSSVVGPFKIFNAVNQHLIRNNLATEPFFHVDLVGYESSNSL